MTDLTRFNLGMGGSMEPDDEGRWVRYEDVAAPVAPALKYVDDPKQTGVGSWCAPGPAAEQKRMFVLRFEDQDRGEAHYTDEAEARAMFARAEARGWNCHLFVHVNRVAPVAPAGMALVPLRMTQAMRDATDSEGWTWKDLLAAAEAITEDQYTELAAPVAPAGPLSDAQIKAGKAELERWWGKLSPSEVAAFRKGIQFAESVLAAPVAAADDWRQYATEREHSAQQVIERHRAEQDALLKLLADARRKTAPAAPAEPTVAGRPYNPTPDMIAAAKRIDPALPLESVRAIWAAMWSAAPVAPAMAPMSETNRLVAYSAASKLRSLGYEWNESAQEWSAKP